MAEVASSLERWNERRWWSGNIVNAGVPSTEPLGEAIDSTRGCGNLGKKEKNE